MQSAHVLFAGVIAGALTAPVPAKSSSTHEAEENRPDAAPIQLWCGPLMIFMASAM
jgi:hypothetical protein